MFQARVTVVRSQDFQQIFAQYDEKTYSVKLERKKGHVLHITAKATWGKTLKTFFKDKPPTSFCDLRAEFQQKFFPVFQSRLLFSRCKEVHLKAAHIEPSYYFEIFPSHNLVRAFARGAE